MSIVVVATCPYSCHKGQSGSVTQCDSARKAFEDHFYRINACWNHGISFSLLPVTEASSKNNHHSNGEKPKDLLKDTSGFRKVRPAMEAGAAAEGGEVTHHGELHLSETSS